MITPTQLTTYLEEQEGLWDGQDLQDAKDGFNNLLFHLNCRHHNLTINTREAEDAILEWLEAEDVDLDWEYNTAAYKYAEKHGWADELLKEIRNH